MRARNGRCVAWVCCAGLRVHAKCSLLGCGQEENIESLWDEEEETYCCNQCDYTTNGKSGKANQKSAIVVHMNRHFDAASGEEFPCDVEGCTHVSGGRSALRQHKREAHKPGGVCGSDLCGCGKTFETAGQLSKHMRDRRPGGPCDVVGCDIAGCNGTKVFKFHGQLVSHRASAQRKAARRAKKRQKTGP